VRVPNTPGLTVWIIAHLKLDSERCNKYKAIVDDRPSCCTFGPDCIRITGMGQSSEIGMDIKETIA